MILHCALLSVCNSFIIENIPKHKTPPSSTYYSSSIYDPLLNQIITIGGVETYTNNRKPRIHTFSLNTYEFGKIEKLSDYEPTAYAYQASYLRSDRKIIQLGYSSGFTSFNLVNRAWSIEPA